MRLEELGNVVSADIVIVGGGLAGLSCAIKTKETNPTLDVLVVDRSTPGWSGQSTKAGNGILVNNPAAGYDTESYVQAMTERNGDYLNDQDMLRILGDHLWPAVQDLMRWGVAISCDENGEPICFTPPFSAWNGAGVELELMRKLRAYALKTGVRILSRVQILRLLKDGERVAGACGIGVDDGAFYTFRCKAVVIATAGCHYKFAGMFVGYGEGIAMAYHAGAQMRSAEFFSNGEVIYKATNQPVYGGFTLVFKQLGENVSDKYGVMNPFEVSRELLLGMAQEVKLGNGPLYCDLSNPDETLIAIGGKGMEIPVRMHPDKLAWSAHSMAKFAKYSNGYEMGLKPEVTIKLAATSAPIRVDHDLRTTVPGLWAVGSCCYHGQGYEGWTRGDGLGNAVNTGTLAAGTLAAYAAEQDFAAIDPAQAAAYKEELYAPLHRTKPDIDYGDMFDEISDIVQDMDALILKTDESMASCIERIAALQVRVPELAANDIHELLKCHEVESTLLCAEMAFKASRMRTESRGMLWYHFRADHPTRDDKNWLKWIIAAEKDGEMCFWTEDIPMERYKYRPEGWVAPQA